MYSTNANLNDDVRPALAAAKPGYDQKLLFIGETGWPTEGGTSTGGSLASMAGLQRYLDDFVCAANKAGTRYFWCLPSPRTAGCSQMCAQVRRL
jgi:exo-beta-1,3-glucanase (GH17 family)